ncbi:hypothetical protein BV25DRAFT_1799217 [Artomyces pyxidatus]|uniref:Uncharacterized protein n=1 Tax=Artomyces pyxidatus TaxID=48021 RepID=A0ACB8T950_9AGAM|nr:hypothetical protein BV25DRAFT_1799217 [Artomyces pyxidatus]
MASVETSPAATVEINDALFCQHFKEVCSECNVDNREENDGFFGFDFMEREGLEAPPASITKDGVYQCKKHGSACTLRIRDDTHATSTAACNQCYGWKKQITRARAAAKKAGKK